MDTIVTWAADTCDAFGQNAFFLPWTLTNRERHGWLTTLQELRNCDETPFLKRAIELWLQYGRIHAYDEHQELRPFAGVDPTRERPEGPVWTHCGWRGCMCYQQKPLYRLGACKGCGRVYYCGKTCQKRSVRLSGCFRASTEPNAEIGETATASSVNAVKIDVSARTAYGPVCTDRYSSRTRCLSYITLWGRTLILDAPEYRSLAAHRPGAKFCSG